MKFSELDVQMRVYEESLDQIIPPHLFIVARLDGRAFTKMTSTVGRFEKPFDERFRDLMIITTRSLMSCGFKVNYAYTESDEISLLFDLEENSFNRKVRKLNTTLAGEASAAFSLEFGHKVSFDCRMVPLPGVDDVCDYFRWRQEDANRNALNSYCYWKLREGPNGLSARAAASTLNKRGFGYKVDLLSQLGVDYNEVPKWQQYGVGLWFEEYVKEGFNPITNQSIKTSRRRICSEDELPTGDDYADLIRKFV